MFNAVEVLLHFHFFITKFTHNLRKFFDKKTEIIHLRTEISETDDSLNNK